MVLTRRGFTLIELLIVIGIIAILTVAFLPTALRAPAKARDASRVKAINDIAAAIESYQLSGRGPMRDGATPGCFVNAANTLATAGIPPLVASNFGDGRFPGDAGVQSCPSVLTAAGDNPSAKFPYYFRRIGAGGPYVLAARVEVDATANVFLADATPWATIDTCVGINLAACQALLRSNATVTGGNSTPYFMLIGQ